MDWYNDLNTTNFIDSTQEIIGGGNISSTISIIENTGDLIITDNTPNTEEETTIGNVLLPAVFNEEEGTFDLYIRNTNQNGRIFLTTRGDGEKVKIEDGLLYIYYDYDFVNAPTIPGGWTDIVNYLVTTRQLANVNSTAILGVAGEATSALLNADSAFTLAGSAFSLAQTAEGQANGAFTSANLANAKANSLNGRVTQLESRNIEDAVPNAPNIGTATNNGLRQQHGVFGENAFNASLTECNRPNCFRSLSIKD